MLSNHADRFFTTPMRTTIVSGNIGNQCPMPAPREASMSAAPGVLPGIGAPAFPGVGDAAGATMSTAKVLGFLALGWLAYRSFAR